VAGIWSTCEEVELSPKEKAIVLDYLAHELRLIKSPEYAEQTYRETDRENVKRRAAIAVGFGAEFVKAKMKAFAAGKYRRWTSGVPPLTTPLGRSPSGLRVALLAGSYPDIEGRLYFYIDETDSPAAVAALAELAGITDR